jgi:hypothetical protein
MRFIAAVLPLALAAISLAGRDDAFIVGALRRDGIIVPFAAYDGKRWSAPWPLPEQDRAIPINVTSVPKHWWGAAGVRDTFQAWVDGAEQTVLVIQPDVARVHCPRQVGLRSDYRPVRPPPPPDEQPYPKDGLAVSPPRPVERIAVLQGGAVELLPLWPTLRDAFNKAERDTASRFIDPMSQPARERNDPEIEFAYAYGTDPRVYYVEASRTYRSFGAEHCTVAFGTGWVVERGGSYKTLAMTVDLVPCDRYGATFMLPFGVMTLRDHTYWLAQFSGWDHERFVVVDVKPKDVEAVVNVWGGGC